MFGFNQALLRIFYPGKFEDIHKEYVVFFDSLYEVVTKCLLKFCEDKTNNLDDEDIEWVKCLIDGFKIRYDNWIFEEKDYLSEIYSKKWDLLSFWGHVFLHISYDLPIVVSESFNNCYPSEDVLMHREDVFRKLEKPLKEALDSDWYKPWFMKNKVWQKTEFEMPFFNHIVALRISAWHHGVRIMRTKNISNGKYEDKKKQLHDSVMQIMKFAISRPVIWSKFTYFSIPNISDPVFNILDFIDINIIIRDYLVLKVMKKQLHSDIDFIMKSFDSYKEINELDENS